MMYKDKNRRQYARYRTQQLFIEVKVPGVDRHPDRVKGIDFNAHGLAFIVSAQQFDIGEQLELNIRLEKIHLTQLIAEVRNIQDDRYGVKFVFTAEHMKTAAVLDGLEEIARILNASHTAVVDTGLRKTKKRDRFSDKW